MCIALTQTSFTGHCCCTWPCRPSWDSHRPIPQASHGHLDGIPSLKQLSWITELGVIWKLAEGEHNYTVNVIDEDIKKCWYQYGPLRDTTHYWFVFGYRAIDDNSLDWTSSQFLIHLTVHASNPYLSDLLARLQWEAVSKALQMTRQSSFLAPDAVTPSWMPLD